MRIRNRIARKLAYFTVCHAAGLALGMGIAFGLNTAKAFGEPLRPHSEQGGTGVRPANPWAPPAGKDGIWIWSPGPGGHLPWLRNWIQHPHEEPVPGGGGEDLPPG